MFNSESYFLNKEQLKDSDGNPSQRKLLALLNFLEISYIMRLPVFLFICSFSAVNYMNIWLGGGDLCADGTHERMICDFGKSATYMFFVKLNPRH